jgi:hypothetical protein
MKRTLVTLLVLFVAAAVPAAERVDLDALNGLRSEAFARSQAHDLALELADVLGPRLTNSPNHRAAADWAVGRLTEWGLDGPRIEKFDFGSGWSFTRCEARLMAPVETPLAALPKAWTPGTNGTVRGEVVKVKLESDEDLEKQAGQLAGKIVLIDDAPKASTRTRPAGEWSDEELEEAKLSGIPSGRTSNWMSRYKKRWKFASKLASFLVDEGVLALGEVSSAPNGVIRGGGVNSARRADYPRGVPVVYFSQESYGRMLRLLDRGENLELELTVDAEFHDDDPMAPNVLAELPGTDRSGEVVMIGAHLDSVHLGTGAVDDGAGSAVVLEAARLLKSLGVKPRRTIRFALWGGEEQGLLGSRAWVERHIADRELRDSDVDEELPAYLNRPSGAIQPKPQHSKLSGYFTFDYGSGRVRGIYTLGNVAVAPIFEQWIAPLADLGVTAVSKNAIPAGGSDHSAFDRIGVPGFMFIQDPLDYFTNSLHSNLDTAEHLNRDDLVQASIAVAYFAWQAANRDAMLPRKPLPQPTPEKKSKKESKKKPGGE